MVGIKNIIKTQYGNNKKKFEKLATNTQTHIYAICTSVKGGPSLLSLNLYNFSGPIVFKRLQTETMMSVVLKLLRHLHIVNKGEIHNQIRKRYHWKDTHPSLR